VMALGVLTIIENFGAGGVIHGVVGLIFLAGAFFAVFEIGRQVGRTDSRRVNNSAPTGQ